MNGILASMLLFATAVPARAEPTIIDEIVVTAVAPKPALSRNVIADVKQAPSEIVPRIELPLIDLAPLARVPERG